MEPYQNPHSKEACLARSPGNRKKKSAKEKGNDFEKEIQGELQKTSKRKVQRNHQGKLGGGISNPDISYGEFNIEAKAETTLSIPEWTRNLLKETPPNKRPGLAYKCEGLTWLSIRLDDRLNFAVQLIEELGGTVELPYWVNI